MLLKRAEEITNFVLFCLIMVFLVYLLIGTFANSFNSQKPVTERHAGSKGSVRHAERLCQTTCPPTVIPPLIIPINGTNGVM